MRYTNNLNLPEPMVVALTYDEYNAGLGDFTPSSLSRPPCMKKIESMYEHLVTKDVAENFHLMMGSVVHKILELSDGNGVVTKESGGVRWIERITKKETTENTSLKEERVYAKIGKYLIGAQFDHLWVSDEALQDYKNTSVYKFKRGYDGLLPDVPEWAIQLNINAYILKHNPMVERGGKLVPFKEGIGFDPPEIKKLQIVGILKDHSKTKAKRESGYPKYPISVRDIGFMSDQEVVDYVNERGDAHTFAKEHKLSEIPPCTDEEIWAKPTKYAVMKTPTAKKSSKNCDSMDEARAYKNTKPGFEKAKIEVRQGERTRCDGYCDAADFCPHYQLFLKEQNKPNKLS